VEQVEGGRVDCVTAEVPEEISVLFEDRYFYAGAGQEKAKHHAGRAAANNATTSVQLFQVRPSSAYAKRLQQLYLTRAFVLARFYGFTAGRAKC